MFRRKDPEAYASVWLPAQEWPKTAATWLSEREIAARCADSLSIHQILY